MQQCLKTDENSEKEILKILRKGNFLSFFEAKSAFSGAKERLFEENIKEYSEQMSFHHDINLVDFINITKKKIIIYFLKKKLKSNFPNCLHMK
mgnify:CR=1 FL=1